VFKNKFIIAFEGIAGSGKTTQCSMLFDYFKNKGLNCRYLKALYDRPNQNMINEIEKYCTDKTFFAKLKRAMRVYETSKYFFEQLTNNSKYEIIIFDRYKHTNSVILKNKGLDNPFFTEALIDWLPNPNVLFHLDLDSKTSIGRVITRGNNKRKYDTEEGLNTFAKSLLLELKPDNYFKINALDSIETINNIVVETIDRLLPKENIDLFRK
jgi:thymidylate kinase